MDVSVAQDWRVALPTADGARCTEGTVDRHMGCNNSNTGMPCLLRLFERSSAGHEGPAALLAQELLVGWGQAQRVQPQGGCCSLWWVRPYARTEPSWPWAAWERQETVK